MVKLLLIGVVAVLLLAGSLTGLTIMGIVPDFVGLKPMLGMAEPSDGADGDTAVAAVPAYDPGPEPTFMLVPQLAIPVIKDGTAGAHLNLSLRMHVDRESQADVTRAMPRINDAILTGLMQKLPDLQDRNGRLDLPSVKVVVNTLVRREMGAGPVHDVLIDNAYFR